MRLAARRPPPSECGSSVILIRANNNLCVPPCNPASYDNFAGLMRGDLTADMGQRGVRKLRKQQTWQKPGGAGSITLPGRAVLLCRNVGMHMYATAMLQRPIGNLQRP